MLALFDGVQAPPALSEALLGHARGLAARIADEELRRTGGGAGAAGDDAPLAPGSALGPWEVLAQVGEGGQGRVYRVRHRHLGRTAAAKVPRAAYAGRILKEAKLAARIEDARIVRVLDVVPEHDPPYLVLEWCPGGSLAERLARPSGPGPGLALAEVGKVAEDLLRALAVAHRAGVVHCDVKPGNILFDADGNALLADLGIGRVPLDEAARLSNTNAATGAGTVAAGAGTPLYLAPEQERPDLLRGAPLDGRADLFAAGKVIFEMLTGASPRTVRPPSRLRPGLDQRWDDVVFRLLEERREDRFASAEDAREALIAIWGGRPHTPAAASVGGPSYSGAMGLLWRTDAPAPRSAPVAPTPYPDGVALAANHVAPALRRDRLRWWLGGLAVVTVVCLGVVTGRLWFGQHFQQSMILAAGLALAFHLVLALFTAVRARHRFPAIEGALMAAGLSSIALAVAVANLGRGGELVIVLGDGPVFVHTDPLAASGITIVLLLLLATWLHTRALLRGARAISLAMSPTPSPAPAPAPTPAPAPAPSSAPAPAPPPGAPVAPAGASRPSLWARIAAVVAGIAAVAGAVAGGYILVVLLVIGAFIAAAVRGCGGEVRVDPSAEVQLILMGALAVAVSVAGIIGVIWGVAGIIRRAFQRRTLARAQAEGAAPERARDK